MKQQLRQEIRPFVLHTGEGEHLRGPVGGPAVIKARAETTGGTFTALENDVPPLQGPPLHLHVREDEMYYVLDGRLRFKADDGMFEAGSGSFVFVPRGTPHCFQNIGAEHAKILVMFTPSGMERFFERHAALPPGPVDPAVFEEIAGSAWMKVLGPPLSVTDPL